MRASIAPNKAALTWNVISVRNAIAPGDATRFVLDAADIGEFVEGSAVTYSERSQFCNIRPSVDSKTDCRPRTARGGVSSNSHAVARRKVHENELARNNTKKTQKELTDPNLFAYFYLITRRKHFEVGKQSGSSDHFLIIFLCRLQRFFGERCGGDVAFDRVGCELLAEQNVVFQRVVLDPRLLGHVSDRSLQRKHPRVKRSNRKCSGREFVRKRLARGELSFPDGRQVAGSMSA